MRKQNPQGYLNHATMPENYKNSAEEGGLKKTAFFSAQRVPGTGASLEFSRILPFVQYFFGPCFIFLWCSSVVWAWLIEVAWKFCVNCVPLGHLGTSVCKHEGCQRTFVTMNVTTKSKRESDWIYMLVSQSMVHLFPV